jgi:hypothetical protein
MINMNDGYRDLAPLRPRGDPERWARMVAAVERAAAPELARRRAAGANADLLVLLSDWTRRAMPAALAVAAAAGTLLMLGPGSSEVEAGPGVSEALGYPEVIAVWVETDRTPTLEEVVISLEGENR